MSLNPSEPISKYVPALVGSGYDGVRTKDVLQMSSGVSWDETYLNPFSDVNRFGLTLFLGGSLDGPRAWWSEARPTLGQGLGPQRAPHGTRRRD